jgi:hypothetical protein
MKNIFVCGFFILSQFLAAEQLPVISKTNNLFSIENLTSEGKLEFKIGQQTELIEYGKDKPHYGIGMVFLRKNLPDSFTKDLGKNEIIQIALGNKGNTGELITQYGAITLRLAQISKQNKMTFTFQDVSKPDKSRTESAFIMFNSSQMKFSSDDQEKLKNTFFSSSGELTLTPVGTSQAVFIKNKGTKLPFQKQTIQLDIKAALATPFTSEKASLTGTVEMALYSPSGEEADDFIAELAENSLEKNPEISPPTEAPRTLASPEPPAKKN